MPDPAQARLEAALPAALERLRATPGVYAALWCGSAARGEATAHSDLDFHALVGGDRRWRSNFTVQGVPVEVFHNPARQIRALLAAGDAATVAMFAQGRPALPHPELDALCAEARARHAAGPTPRLPTEAERFALIEELMDARAQADAGDPVHAVTVLTALSRQLMPLLYARHGWWVVKREHWARDLGERAPDLAAELRALLVAPDLAARQAAFETLARRVTGDFTYREVPPEPQEVGSS